MKCFYFFLLSFTLLSLLSCEKSLQDEEEGGKSNTNLAAGVSPDIKQGALTIAEAQQATVGTSICVKGFIVAATKQGIGKADYASPFDSEYTTALVLASRKSNGTNGQFSKEELFPVCLTDASKGIRDAYNLPQHEQYWNNYVYIVGSREEYMSLPGLKKVKGVEIDFNHVVTPDEEADAIDDDGDDGNGDPGDDSGGDDDDDDDGDTGSGDEGGGNGGGDNGDSSQPTSNVLTVAEAKTQAEHTKLKVQGYIVAALSGGRDNISFEAPGFGGNRTAIVLADKKFESGTAFDIQGYSDLLIVYLADCKPGNIKGILNLVDHPENQNKLIRIQGTMGFYYGTKLLLQLTDYEWVEP